MDYQQQGYWSYMTESYNKDYEKYEGILMKDDNVNSPSHYNQSGIVSDGGPSTYYDFEPEWKTWNDFADYKSQSQWKEHSFHLGNVGKSICRWGDKGGTTKPYDARKIIYSGLRVLMMLEGKESVHKYLSDLRENPQFRD